MTKEELGELVRGCGDRGGRIGETKISSLIFRDTDDHRIVRFITAAQAEQAVHASCIS